MCKLPNKCWCGDCRKLYDAARFQRIKATRREQVKTRRKELLHWTWELKSKPCADCKNTYPPIVMQFDHLEDNKRASIADLVSRGLGKESIQKEIDKCELVCANCHAIRTFSRR